MNQQYVHLCIFNSLSDWETGYAVAGINNPQFQKHPGRYRIRTVALQKDPVMTIGGITIKPDLLLEDVSPTDSAMVILPGGTAWDEGKHTEFVEMARAFLRADKPVAAICGATSSLARGGLLDNCRHTSNAREYLISTAYLGAEHYEDEPAVTDGNIITASGLAPVDFAYHIFKCLDIYSEPVAEAWYGLFKTGRAEYYKELMTAVSGD